MNTPRTFRFLSHALLGSAFLTSAAMGLTPAEFDAHRAKAERGNAIAQYNLGLAFANRDEATYDPVQAYAWLSLAAANGTTGKALEQLTGQLTPAQLEAGKRQLASLIASPVKAAPTETSPIIAADDTPAVSPARTPVVPSAPAPAALAEPDPDQKKLSAELAAAWKENELLKAGLGAQLADANKRVAIAEAALASKDKQIVALNARLAETPAAPALPVGASAELASLRTERDQLQTTANAAASELNGLRTALDKASAEQAALRGKLANAATDLTEARRAQALAEAEAASLKAAADRASAERLAVAAQLETATAELAAAKAASRPSEAHPQPDPRVATLENERDQLAASVKTLTEERDALTAQLAAAKAAIPAAPAPEVVTAPIPMVPTAPAAVDADTDAKLAELEKAKAESETKLTAALRSFTLQQAEIDRLQKAIASIDEERAATATKLEAAQAELSTIRPQAAGAATVSAEAAQLRHDLAAANQRIADQSAAIEAGDRSLADARKTIDAATSELVATRDQLRLARAQSAASANEVQQLKTRLALAGSLPAATTPSRPGVIAAASIALPPPAPAPETPVAPRVHTVVAGDSLSKISKQYYGTAGRWNDILQANREVIRNPDALALGAQLRIP